MAKVFHPLPLRLTSRTLGRLTLALALGFVVFVIWLVPTYIVMSPDHTYRERVVREAQLVAAAIARSAMTSRPSSKIGDPKDPRIIAARKRSPFRKNRAESVLKQMREIVNKRIVLYDHRRRIVLDTYNFDSKEKIDVSLLPDLMKDKRDQRIAEPIYPPNYLPAPPGNSLLILDALRGNSIAKSLTPRKRADKEIDPKGRFKPREPVLFVAVPVRRLKLVQGAVLLIDDKVAERVAWRWRTLREDNLPFFAALLVVLVLLLLWLKDSLIKPLARLAYLAEGGGRHNNEISMLSHRQALGELATRNFAYAASFFKKQRGKTPSKADKHTLADSEMASLIDRNLMKEKLEMTNFALIVQQVVKRQNMRERSHIVRKAPSSSQELTYQNKVLLQKMETNGHSNPWQLPLFALGVELTLDYLIQVAARAQTGLWENGVRITLVRHAKKIDFILEDDGEDIQGTAFTDWLTRGLDENQFLWTKASIEKVLDMSRSSLSISPTRPSQLKLSFPLSVKSVS